jgi:hypothetical protein
MKPKQRSLKKLGMYQFANPKGPGWVSITTLTPEQLMNALADYMDLVDDLEFRVRKTTQVIEVFQLVGGKS